MGGRKSGHEGRAGPRGAAALRAAVRLSHLSRHRVGAPSHLGWSGTLLASLLENAGDGSHPEETRELSCMDSLSLEGLQPSWSHVGVNAGPAGQEVVFTYYYFLGRAFHGGGFAVRYL